MFKLFPVDRINVIGIQSYRKRTAGGVTLVDVEVVDLGRRSLGRLDQLIADERSAALVLLGNGKRHGTHFAGRGRRLVVRKRRRRRTGRQRRRRRQCCVGGGRRQGGETAHFGCPLHPRWMEDHRREIRSLDGQLHRTRFERTRSQKRRFAHDAHVAIHILDLNNSFNGFFNWFNFSVNGPISIWFMGIHLDTGNAGWFVGSVLRLLEKVVDDIAHFARWSSHRLFRNAETGRTAVIEHCRVRSPRFPRVQLHLRRPESFFFIIRW